MPKYALMQSGFNTGEVSPLCYGVVENPRYKKGLQVGLNYLPTLQGPLIRRPGTKCPAVVKDSANPPFFIPFQFSATQNYMLEFGEHYIRFFANNGQIVTSGTTYKINGLTGDSGLLPINSMSFWATRATSGPQAYETIATATSVTTGSILELASPYAVADVALIRWAQNGDTLYLFHPNYPPYKLQRQTQTAWKIQTVYWFDGPYLAANSFASVGDSVGTQLAPLSTSLIGVNVKVVDTGTISGAITDPGASGQIQITTSAAHGLVSGQNVFIYGVVGTTEANCFSNTFGRTNSTGPGYWVVLVTSPTTFLLLGSVFTNAWSSGGKVAPALFALSAAQIKAGGYIQDFGRLLALQVAGVRYWGFIETVFDAVTVLQRMGGSTRAAPVTYPATTTADLWFLGTWSGAGTSAANFVGNGYPSCAAFHQNRLWVAGVANSPQEVDSSKSLGSFEDFSASNAATLAVTDANACSFVLASDDFNPLRWMASTAQALIAGTYSSEWSMTPSGNGEALTPTNFNAQQSSFFGSANIAPVKIGNAVMYVQRAARKLREMAYFFYTGTFKSTDLTEISEHITLPSLIKIGVQKETQPLIWGLRADGALVSLIYNRDDVSLSVGWTRHQLGGQSDASGAPPVVLDFGFIPDPLTTFDQMWLIVRRWINGATVCTIEYMTNISNDGILQEDSFQGDCGGTYDNPLVVTNISVGNPAVVTSAAHGLANGNAVKITGVVGLNLSTTDINGNVTITNLVNEQTFVVASVATNTFALHDFNGNAVSSVGYGAWISGGQARKLVSTISGFTWLENETVGTLCDGAIGPDLVVSAGGVLTLPAPAAKVQVGYRYKSQGQLLRAEAGAADGTSIGKTRRTTRAAFQLHRVGDLKVGTDFNNLIPVDFAQADQNQADTCVPLFSGMIREGLESASDFESQVCFEQSSMLPGTIQSITSFGEEQDL